MAVGRSAAMELGDEEYLEQELKTEESELEDVDRDDSLDLFEAWSDGELQEGLALCDLAAEMKEEEEQGWAASATGTGFRVFGIVEKFAPKRGFGLILPEGRSDHRVFAHWTQIVSNDRWPQLKANDRVEYTLALQGGKFVAVQITAPGGAPISCGPAEAAAQRQLSDFRVAGRVDYFHKAGYGFLRNDDAIDWPTELPANSTIYVSREELVLAEGSRSFLDAGMPVEFRVFKPADREIAAAEVTGPGGHPLVCPQGPPRPSTLASKGKGGGKGALLGKASALIQPVERTIQKVRVAAVEKPSGIERCKFFLQGFCRRGVACFYAHDADLVCESEDAFGDATSRPEDPRLGAERRETESRLTTSILEALAELRHLDAAKSISPRGGGASPSQQLRDPWLQPRWCGDADVGAGGSDFFGEPKPGGCAVLCRFFQQGRCLKGAACPFVHRALVETPRNSKLCVYYAAGQCNRGSACLFSHNAIPAMRL